MAKKNLEKLEAELSRLEETLQSNLARKETLLAEVDAAKAETLLTSCQKNGISVSDAIKGMTLFAKIREIGMTSEDILDLLSEPDALSKPTEKIKTTGGNES